jgi:hypothetical protein
MLKRKRNWRIIYTIVTSPNLWYFKLLATSPCMADTIERSNPHPGQGIPVKLRNVHMPGKGIFPIRTFGLSFLGGLRMRHPNKIPKQTRNITRFERKLRFIKKRILE